MPLRVEVIEIVGVKRSRIVCEAMRAGIRACGDQPIPCKDVSWRGPNARIGVFYGMAGGLKDAIEAYKRAGGTAVYIDMGYWGRKSVISQLSGFHKVSVNARHPTAYFQAIAHPHDRIKTLGVVPKPWKKGGQHVLVAGMGGKGAPAEGFKPEEWERKAILELKKHTGLSIVYRPKPNWKLAKPIPGTHFSPASDSIEDLLDECHAVVTHHSNVAVDGLVAGVPAFCWHGVASPMALKDLAMIGDPYRPEGREQWLADIAYCQWNLEEMRSGATWRHLKNEGLIP